MMRECKRHSQPGGGGVCARCLEERLSWLWRGESFRHDNNDDDDDDDDGSMEASTSAGERPPSLTSVRQQLQVLGVARRPSHPTDDGGPPQNSKPIIEEWVAFHARRRGGEGLELRESSLNDDERRAVSDRAELRILMNAHKMRSQSMPLDFRSAEETAARVINECAANESEEDELGIFYEAPRTVQESEEGRVGSEEERQLQRCFSPKWQSPKWVKVLASPMTSSRNRVFPSRSKDDQVRKRSNKRGHGPRLDSSDWGFSRAEGASGGGSSPLWRGMQQRSKRGSVFSWLQDAETVKHEQTSSEQLTSSSSSDSWLRDLTTVGHLHEIAEELEIVEESSEEEKEDEDEDEEEQDLGDISSFGKFLLQAAQRQPNAHLTRLVSASARP